MNRELGSHGFNMRNGDTQAIGEYSQSGKYGRLFPHLKSAFSSQDEGVVEHLYNLSQSMILEEMDAERELRKKQEREKEKKGKGKKIIPAGYTYLGQFIDHDITYDTTGINETVKDPTAIKNFRTPLLDLDSVYGLGPTVQPYLYQLKDKNLFSIGFTQPLEGKQEIHQQDLYRATNGCGLIADPRNDENLIISQLHVLFLHFHNAVVKGLIEKTVSPIHQISSGSHFFDARKIVTWHYQWIVLHDYLKGHILKNGINYKTDKEDKESIIDTILREGRKYYQYSRTPYIPVEFSAAAFRLGHSMIDNTYVFNKSRGKSHLLELFGFRGNSSPDSIHHNVPIPDDWIIDWSNFFDDSSTSTNIANPIDSKLVFPLKLLSITQHENKRNKNLAFLNLLRGYSLSLPSGETVARFLGITPLETKELEIDSYFQKRTPLWYYILKEAEIQTQGERLGEVGRRIVGEVFIGLLQGDSSSFISQDPKWKPSLPCQVDGHFTMNDLIMFVKKNSQFISNNAH